jgi:plasmid stabilization system protein ParE
MRYRSVLSPGAKADIRSAVRWYQHADPNLAFRFTLEILAAQHRIERFPFQFPIYKGTIRRALLKRFPYSILYYLKDHKASVIAVVHQRRSDNIWMDRRRQ